MGADSEARAPGPCLHRLRPCALVHKQPAARGQPLREELVRLVVHKADEKQVSHRAPTDEARVG
jgi:hypothetical protein